MRKTIKGSKKIITRMTAFVLSLILLFGWEIGSYADNFDAETVIAEAITTVDDTEETLDTISFDEIEDVQVEDLGDFDDAAKEFDGVVDDTLNNADTANTSEDKDEAFEAKEKAEDNLSDAKTKLDDAVTAYEEAGKAIDEVEGKITDEKTALASGKAEKRFNIKDYLWILLLIATTVVASLLYAYYSKKEEEEEASEN